MSNESPRPEHAPLGRKVTPELDTRFRDKQSELLFAALAPR